MRKSLIASMLVGAGLLGLASVGGAQAGGLPNLSLMPNATAPGVTQVHNYWYNGCHYHHRRVCTQYDSYGNCSYYKTSHYCHKHYSGGGSSY